MMKVVVLVTFILFSMSCFGNSVVKSALQEVSKEYGIHYVTLSKIADIESSLNPNAKNPNSSARGLFQITDGTQTVLLKKGARVCDMFNAKCNAEYAARLMNLNISYYKKKFGKTFRANTYNVYLAHFFGTRQAYKFLTTDENLIASEVFKREAKYNPNLFGKNRTIKEVSDLIKNKIKKARVL